MTAYTPNFFATHADRAYFSGQVILPLILERVPVRTVVDVGCGTGEWLAVASELGCEVLGLDGDWIDRSALRIPREKFQVADLTQPLPSGRFDLALSLEVAEHLPPERAESLVADLVRLAPAVLFSAAIPGQRGRGHVNEQWADYWRDLFASHNYGAIDCVRLAVWDSGVADWYAQNTLLYREGERESLSMPLRVVHPGTFEWVRETPTLEVLRKRLPAMAREFILYRILRR